MSDQNDLPERLARPNQLTTLTQDQLVAALLRLTMEISVLRDRVDTQERLLVANGIVAADAVETYEPDADVQAQRMRTRTELIERLFADLSE